MNESQLLRIIALPDVLPLKGRNKQLVLVNILQVPLKSSSKPAHRRPRAQCIVLLSSVRTGGRTRVGRCALKGATLICAPRSRVQRYVTILHTHQGIHRRAECLFQTERRFGDVIALAH